MASTDQPRAPARALHQSSIPDMRDKISNYHILANAASKAPHYDADEYYSFPSSKSTASNTASLHSLPSLLASTTTTPARPSARALEAAASLSALLSNPRQPQEKWHQHHQRILEAILPPKGFDSVAVQLPTRTRSLNTAENPSSSSRSSPSRLAVTIPGGPAPLADGSLTALNASAGSGVSLANTEARPATSSSSRKQRVSRPTDEKVVQAATAAAAIAIGNAAGTTGAIASAAAAAAALCQEEQELSRREASSAFTLLCVDGDVVSCSIMSKVCEKWGQPYETVSNGEKALELYKGAPEKYRCILMNIAMPGQDGFETTKLIRQFEEASGANDTSVESTEQTSKHDQKVEAESQSSETRNGPVRRAVIIGMALRSAPPPSVDSIKEGGFDMVVEKPLHLRLLSELLFSGPETNAVAVYGAVDPERLRQAGYPLRIRSLRARRRPPLDNVFGPSFG